MGAQGSVEFWRQRPWHALSAQSEYVDLRRTVRDLPVNVELLSINGNVGILRNLQRITEYGSTTNEVRGGGPGLVFKPRMDANPHE